MQEAPQIADETLTADQAASLLGVSRPTLEAYAKQGLLPFVRYQPAGWRRYRLQDLLEFRERSLVRREAS